MSRSSARSRRGRIAAASSIAVLALCSTACRTQPWELPAPDASAPLRCDFPSSPPLWGGDPHHRSQARAIGPSQLNRKWSSDPIQYIEAPWMVLGDGALALFTDAALTTFDPKDGHIAVEIPWSPVLAGAPTNAMASADGAIYGITAGGPDIAAFDVNARAIRWHATAPCELVSGPLVGDDGAVFVGCADRVLAFDACDGHLHWSTDAGGSTHFSDLRAIALGGELIAFERGPQRFIAALDAATGRARFHYGGAIDVEALVNDPIVQHDGAVYFQRNDSFPGKPTGSFSAFGFSVEGSRLPPTYAYFGGAGEPGTFALSYGDLLWLALPGTGVTGLSGFGVEVLPPIPDPRQIWVDADSTVYVETETSTVARIDGKGRQILPALTLPSSATVRAVGSRVLYCIESVGEGERYRVAALGD